MRINIYIPWVLQQSVLVLIGSDSHCNSFVVSQLLLFSYQMENIPFVIHSRSNESNAVGKKKLVFIFLLAKYSPMSHKNGGQKWEWQYPKYCLCWKLLHTRQKYSDIYVYISNLFAKLQHAKAPGS